ncbi:MAG: hypothetical protein ACJZ2K_04920 [Candidatus Poseidoniaceae archaeon]|tara:strand:- start:146 stop:619 length:474 start_codon:yes stop_codon:yes gene_type:complete
MGKVFSHTTRKGLSPEAVTNALESFTNPSLWPDWNSTAKNMLATNPETLEEGDHIAVFQMIKGGLIEAKWLVNSIRTGENFSEIELLGEGQYRNEREIGKGLKNLKITITFLSQIDGGIEVHSTCEVFGLMLIFSKQINSFMKQQTQTLLDDLSGVK